MIVCRSPRHPLALLLTLTLTLTELSKTSKTSPHHVVTAVDVGVAVAVAVPEKLLYALFLPGPRHCVSKCGPPAVLPLPTLLRLLHPTPSSPSSSSISSSQVTTSHRHILVSHKFPQKGILILVNDDSHHRGCLDRFATFAGHLGVREAKVWRVFGASGGRLDVGSEAFSVSGVTYVCQNNGRPEMTAAHVFRAPARGTVFRLYPLASSSGPLYIERVFLLRNCINQLIHHLHLYRSLHSNSVWRVRRSQGWASAQLGTAPCTSRGGVLFCVLSSSYLSDTYISKHNTESECCFLVSARLALILT